MIKLVIYLFYWPFIFLSFSLMNYCSFKVFARFSYGGVLLLGFPIFSKFKNWSVLSIYYYELNIFTHIFIIRKFSFRVILWASIEVKGVDTHFIPNFKAYNFCINNFPIYFVLCMYFFFKRKKAHLVGSENAKVQCKLYEMD